MNGNIEGTVERVSVDVVQEDGVVALCQQGHGSCDEDRHLSTNGVIDDPDQNLQFASTGLSEEHAKFLPSGRVVGS